MICYSLLQEKERREKWQITEDIIGKIKRRFFTDKRIKRLRKISGGDTYTIIYLKLLLLSLKDSGKLYYDGVETDFIKELALTIDETEDDVMVTVNYLVAQGLMEIITENDEYFLTEIPSLIGSETVSIRRSRKSRGQTTKTLVHWYEQDKGKLKEGSK